MDSAQRKTNKYQDLEAWSDSWGCGINCVLKQSLWTVLRGRPINTKTSKLGVIPGAVKLTVF